MVRYILLVSGRVQGVGFRYFVQYEASFLNLTGYAKNLDTGDVEICIQGKEELVETLLIKIKKGNRFSRIDDFYIRKIPIVENETKFHIRYE
ncbi:acylphosphatase [Clostridium polyendosporum]|uniref:Acylphosphatase n=1 Tax=Clostridium polyendosporum TaxID=69208 RepID=A0A919RYI4_9CLOT|nr:acylphosphatase [Clostridium polyendosporum]GIM28612.1 acylphosphatase [Clostridium polyendosporum]